MRLKPVKLGCRNGRLFMFPEIFRLLLEAKRSRIGMNPVIIAGRIGMADCSAADQMQVQNPVAAQSVIEPSAGFINSKIHIAHHAGTDIDHNIDQGKIIADKFMGCHAPVFTKQVFGNAIRIVFRRIGNFLAILYKDAGRKGKHYRFIGKIPDMAFQKTGVAVIVAFSYPDKIPSCQGQALLPLQIRAAGIGVIYGQPGILPMPLLVLLQNSPAPIG